MPRVLRAAGLRVEAHSDHFADPRVADSVWLREVFRKGWIALSHDRNMRYDLEAQRVVMEENGRLFLLRGKCTHPALAEMFVRGIPKVEKVLVRTAGPFIAAVRRIMTHSTSGVEVAVTFTRDQWLAGSAGRTEESDEEE